MFTASFLVGIYAYLIFFLGLLGLLARKNIFLLTLIFVIITALIFKKKFNLKNLNFKLGNNFFNLFLILIFLFQVIVNLAGALGPELAFDALWYHLTLPKLYLLKHEFYFVPGGTLYYSTMPQVTEMLYTAALALNSEILAKLVHFSFGLLICVAIYQVAKKYLPSRFALFSVLIFYSNLVVAWESITAYIDLSRTFFEFMSFWAFIEFLDRNKTKWLIFCGLLSGLAISTKLLSIGTVFIFSILIISLKYTNPKLALKKLSIYLFFVMIPIFPWILNAYTQRGNPVYPLFSSALQSPFQFPSLNPLIFVKDILHVLIAADDPLSPIYIVFLPLILLTLKNFNEKNRIFLYFSGLALIIWYFTPHIGGGRFMLPFLPAFSILCSLTLYNLKNQLKLKMLLIFFIIFLSIITIFFRGITNAKYLKYDFGLQSKEAFLRDYLEFNQNNFADIDGYFTKTIKADDKVLLYGFHNLFYVNFPFIDGSWVKKGDQFNYIAVKEGELPEIFKDWNLIYYNQTTNVKLYSKNGNKWVY